MHFLARGLIGGGEGMMDIGAQYTYYQLVGSQRRYKLNSIALLKIKIYICNINFPNENTFPHTSESMH